MPKNAKKVVAKKATKKSTKKVTKRVVAKRARVVKPTATEAAAQAQRESLEQASVILGTALHQAAEAAFDNGQFSANGLLNLNVRNSVQAARGEVVGAIRNLVNASIELSDSASLSQAERDVATAAQRLAVARVELALDGLENAVRG